LSVLIVRGEGYQEHIILNNIIQCKVLLRYIIMNKLLLAIFTIRRLYECGKKESSKARSSIK
jgi:hypothetical protein